MKLTYFVESREESLRKGYQQRADFLRARVFTEDVLAKLSTQSAAIALAVFAEETGIDEIIRLLNHHNIALDLWLNLPFETGYWQSKSNITIAKTALAKLLNWIARAGFKIRNIGIDIEPPIEIVRLLSNHQYLRLIAALMKLPRSKFAQIEFEKMLAEINRSYGVDIYKIPIIADFLVSRKIFNLYSIPQNFFDDQRNNLVSMLYSSVAPFHADQFIKRYIRAQEAPAIGIVSSDGDNPGVDIFEKISAQEAQLITIEALNRDIKQVRNIFDGSQPSPSLYIYALNGIGTLDKISQALRAG